MGLLPEGYEDYPIGQWSIRQNGIARTTFWGATDNPEDALVSEIHHSSFKTGNVPERIMQIVVPGGLLCFGGCNSSYTAGRWAGETGRSTIGFNTDADLEQFASPKLQEYFRSGTLHRTMDFFPAQVDSN